MKAIHASRFIRIFRSIGVSILLLGQSAVADVLDTWTTNQVSTNWFGLRGVVYGNGVYVAAGMYLDWGTIISSEDGFNWTVRADANFPDPNSGPSWGLGVYFANNRFVGVSRWGCTSVSTNGTNWVVSYVSFPPLLRLSGGTFGDGRYVVVGQVDPFDGSSTVSNILTSTDGVTWTPRRSHPTEARIIYTVAYGAGTYVAIGEGFSYTSPDAATWTRHSMPDGYLISYCNNIFIVPYGAGTNLISTDGINWDARNTGISNTMELITFANGLFLSRAANLIVTSTDGTNWLQHSQTVPGWGLASDGSRFVTVGYVPHGPVQYDSFVHTSDIIVGLRMTNTSPPKVVLSGLVGRSYQIEAKNDLADTTSWQVLTTLQLPTTPYLFTDTAATNSSHRFYRGVLLP